MSAVEPEMRRMSLGDNPDFDEFKKKVSELFNETDTELLFQWKGKIWEKFSYDLPNDFKLSFLKRYRHFENRSENTFVLNIAITIFLMWLFFLPMSIDSEDDMITMSSEEEFQEALKNISDGLLRIFIKKMNAGKI